MMRTTSQPLIAARRSRRRPRPWHRGGRANVARRPRRRRLLSRGRNRRCPDVRRTTAGELGNEASDPVASHAFPHPRFELRLGDRQAIVGEVVENRSECHDARPPSPGETCETPMQFVERGRAGGRLRADDVVESPRADAYCKIQDGSGGRCHREPMRRHDDVDGRKVAALVDDDAGQDSARSLGGRDVHLRSCCDREAVHARCRRPRKRRAGNRSNRSGEGRRRTGDERGLVDATPNGGEGSVGQPTDDR